MLRRRSSACATASRASWTCSSRASRRRHQNFVALCSPTVPDRDRRRLDPRAPGAAQPWSGTRVKFTERGWIKVDVRHLRMTAARRVGLAVPRDRHRHARHPEGAHQPVPALRPRPTAAVRRERRQRARPRHLQPARVPDGRQASRSSRRRPRARPSPSARASGAAQVQAEARRATSPRPAAGPWSSIRARGRARESCECTSRPWASRSCEASTAREALSILARAQESRACSTSR